MSTFIPVTPFPSSEFGGTTNTMPLAAPPFGGGTATPTPVGKGYNPGRAPLYQAVIPILPLPGTLIVGGSFAM